MPGLQGGGSSCACTLQAPLHAGILWAVGTRQDFEARLYSEWTFGCLQAPCLQQAGALKFHW